MPLHVNRRQMLQFAGALCASNILPGNFTHAATPAHWRLGVVTYCHRLRRELLRKNPQQPDLFHPREFLQHCLRTGAGGMQLSLGQMSRDDAKQLREMLEKSGRYLEAIVQLPKEPADVDRFSQQVDIAMAAGARAARTTMLPGRRYEFFESMQHFRQLDAAGRQSLELAVPVVERGRLPLAIENHKDHRDSERLALLEKISSQYVGACVDTGNSLALLEDPIETARRFAPWAHSVHLKDQALQTYRDGFLLGDIPLGQGSLDLPAIVGVLKASKPDVRFTLELITRDPLKVPVLDASYWRTMSHVPAPELARTLRFVRDRHVDHLQHVSRLSLEDQAALEDQNVAASLQYAANQLGL